MQLSVTRLRLRSWRFLPAAALDTFLSLRQARRTDGFIGGQLLDEPGLAFWTVTGWRDESAMRSFRNAGAHLRAMPKLSYWCSEGSVGHTTLSGASWITPEEAYAIMLESGRTSPLRFPTPNHAAGRPVGPKPPRMRLMVGSSR